MLIPGSSGDERSDPEVERLDKDEKADTAVAQRVGTAGSRGRRWAQGCPLMLHDGEGGIAGSWSNGRARQGGPGLLSEGNGAVAGAGASTGPEEGCKAVP
jgi:hypothetical protein